LIFNSPDNDRRLLKLTPKFGSNFVVNKFAG
jgi:hypothetical protein